MTDKQHKYRTREEWLIAAIEALRPLYEEHGHEIPAYQVSVGWPGGRSKKSTTVGQCWPTHAADDGSASIFVSPVVKNPLEVLEILGHELIHAIDDCESGHRGNFAKIFTQVGFIGRKTTHEAGPELVEKMKAILNELGRYPHGQMKREAKGAAKQKTYMLKLEAICCGYLVRTTQSWIDQGLPSCPCGNEMELVG